MQSLKQHVCHARMKDVFFPDGAIRFEPVLGVALIVKLAQSIP